MTLSNLSLLSVKELKKIARKMSIVSSGEVDKGSLLRAIFETFEDERLERMVSTNLTVRVEATKFSVGIDEEISSSFSQDVVLPPRYNESTVVIMLRDLYWLYCYWDINDKQLEEIYQESNFSTLFLKISRLRYKKWTSCRALNFFEIPIEFDDLDRYIELPRVSGYYGVELGAYLGSASMVIIRSNILDIKYPDACSTDMNDESNSSGICDNSGEIKAVYSADFRYSRLADLQIGVHPAGRSGPGSFYGR